MPTEGLSAIPLRLLLVEDNPDDAMLLERFLRRSGFTLTMLRVETAAELQEALADPDAIDVIIADYNLPRFSGPAALQMVRSAGLDTPFLMMSGAISEETAVESMRAGAQDYITKQNLARLIPVLERELREASGRRKKLAAEIALRASQTRFQRLVDAMPLGLLISDIDGRISYVNTAAEHLLGYPDSALLNGAIPLTTLCPSLDLQAKAHLVGPLESAPFETRCVTAADVEIEVLLGLAVLNPEAESRQRQFAAFIADLTLQKRSEEVLRRTEKLGVAGRLAASIAHEINNPLEAITNCLYLVAQTELPDEARTYLSLAQNELDRVAQITVQTLRFYRSSTQAAHTSLHDLIETVLTLLGSRLTRQEIRVRREFGDIPEVFVHDGEIRQVIANLTGNAIDAMSSGGTLRLRTRSTRHWHTGVAGVRISVADTGTGMSAETQSHVFEPFFSTKGITGTGLGLWVSREIVDKHHGTLRARSRQRREGTAGGTVFSLFLPTVPNPDPQQASVEIE